MKKWYICKYGTHHISAPHECTPIGIAQQVTIEDENQNAPQTFLLMSRFSDWLIRNDLCAFSEDYATALRIGKNASFPILYSEKNPKGSAV